METARKYIILYIILLILIFILTHMTSVLTSRQATELLVSSILFVFLFGIVRSKITGQITPHSVAVYGFYFTLWYFITKSITNLVLKDNNGVILTT